MHNTFSWFKKIIQVYITSPNILFVHDVSIKNKNIYQVINTSSSFNASTYDKKIIKAFDASQNVSSIYILYL